MKAGLRPSGIPPGIDARETLALVVWGLLSAITFFYVVYSGQNFPVQDDNNWVAYYSGAVSPPAGWYWAPHAGHRIPVTRLISIVVARLTHFDSRYLLLLTAALLSAGSLTLVIAARRARGFSSSFDLIFPLYGVSLIHYWNLLQGMQLFLGLFFFLFAVIVSGMLLRFWEGVRGIVIVGFSTVLLSVNGGAGLALSLILLPYLFAVALFLYRTRDPGARRRAALVAILALGGVVPALLYSCPIVLSILSRASSGASPGTIHAGFGEVILNVLAQAWGRLGRHFGNSTHSPFSWLILGLIGAGFLLGVWNIWRDKGCRATSASLLVALTGILCVAGAVALGRRDSPHGGLAIWYATIMAPLPCLIYLIADKRGRAWRILVGLTIAVLGLLGLTATWPWAWREGRLRRRAWVDMSEDLQEGVSFHEIHERYHRAFLPWDKDGIFRMGPTLEIMRERGQGPFDITKGQWLKGLNPKVEKGCRILDRGTAASEVHALSEGGVAPAGHHLILTVTDDLSFYTLPASPMMNTRPRRVEMEILSPHDTEARVISPDGTVQTAPVRQGYSKAIFNLEAGVSLDKVKFSPGMVPGNYRLCSIVVNREG